MYVCIIRVRVAYRHSGHTNLQIHVYIIIYTCIWKTNYYRGLRAKCKGLYIGFLGVLNPVDTEGAQYIVFRL